MAKKKGNYFIQLKRELWHEDYENLSVNAKWLYVTLNELEHRYTGEKCDFFFRSNEDLAKDVGMSLGTLKRSKKELLETDLIQHWLMHFVDKETGKKSKKKISAYRIL
jgi:hypothetical protein